jgi:hypothetical protein
MLRALASLPLCLAMLPAAPPPAPAPVAPPPVVLMPPRCSWRTSDGGVVIVSCSGNICVATRYDRLGNVVAVDLYADPSWCL